MKKQSSKHEDILWQVQHFTRRKQNRFRIQLAEV